MNKRIKYSLAKHKLLTTLYNYILLKKKKQTFEGSNAISTNRH